METSTDPPVLKSAALGPGVATDAMNPRTAGVKTLDHAVSVVIPTKNAGAGFSMLLARLRAQIGIRKLEIIVVDSGSTDSTLAAAKRYGCRILRIKPSGFSHSRARNKGAQAAAGDYLLFMVQDALPTGDRWLHSFLGALLRLARQGAVAATCREFPRADADLFHCFLMHAHYKYLGWGQEDRVTGLSGTDPQALRQGGSLSNVCCLIKKDICTRYGLRGSYAEDLDLGIRLIEDGHKLAYLSSVKVIHSHNRPASYYLKLYFVIRLFYAERFSQPRPPRQRPQEALASVRRLFQILDVLSERIALFCLLAPCFALSLE